MEAAMNKKLMKIFWLRPAIQKPSLLTRSCAFFKTYTLRLTSIILSLFFFLLISAGWTNLGRVSFTSYENAMKYLMISSSTDPMIQFPLNCAAWSEANKKCPKTYPIKHQPSLINHLESSSKNGTCPDYFRWIHEDLRPWKETGITRKMLEGARKHAHFRLVILDGKVYVEKFKESIQSRALFTMWGIVQLARWYPGRLPDLELMFDCDDRPVIASTAYRGRNSGPPPLFRYCSDSKHLDIIFPDWSFWGWAETNIRPWRSVLNDIKEGNNKSNWRDRIPYAYWKGNPNVAPWRADLLKCNVTSKADWNTRLYIQDWNEEIKKGYNNSNLGDQCTHRYKIYIEGWAWSVSEKYILACNSPVLYMTPRFYDFFIRGMVPQRHYWPVRDNNKCKSLKFAVEYGNNHMEKAEAIGTAGSRFIHEDMKMEYVFDYIFHLLNEYSKLLKFKPSISPKATEICAESLACPADGIWRKFMEESLEMSPKEKKEKNEFRSSMNPQEEKLMNIFWLRPAYQRNSWATRMKALIKNPHFRTAVLLISLFVLLVSVFVYMGWIDLVQYSGVTKEKAIKALVKVSESNSHLPQNQFPLDCKAWNRKKTCPNNYPTSYKPKINRDPSSNPTCPEYFRWIHEDLKPWKETGITRDMVERSKGNAHFRLVILKGKVYVENFKDRHPYRVSLTIWGILQFLRFYPGKLPDLELMFDADDLPVIPTKDYRGPNSGPPALFRYCSDWWSYDIVFPDWTFWGWPDLNIRPWRHILKEIKEGNKKIKWKDREPYAYWKGNPHVAGWRGELMTCNPTETVDWNTRLFDMNWDEEIKAGYTQSKLADQCTYRYKIYIEGTAWSVSEKYIFACDSPVLLITLHFHDFFNRGMLPQQHYWPIKGSDKCKSLKFAVEYGNNHTQKAEAIGKAGSRFIHEDMKMEYIYDYIFHLLNEYAKLLRFEPVVPPNAVETCVESMACHTDGNWRKFMEESMESPSHTIPCSLPPPYNVEELKVFNDKKFVLNKEVEMWENEYWEKPTKNDAAI
ncbi:OLC1v1039218C1 [Oldenlandia corymbosa var. corymbosa]|uniref:OLC1v1039218C1 n=1 Tax=Oldenlandia corymbosa var. corymbosa TaxID=529605 RepID=A0AAV1D4K3_OLDCO|nr:OLC1v1039218C1 [Oldenlandia corymbosa var. corymbosa]